MMMEAEMYGMIDSARIDMRPIEPPENTSSMPAMPPAFCGEHLGQGVRIDARDRDVGADAEDKERAHGEPQALLQLGRLTDRAPIQVGGELLGGGCHGRPHA